MTEKRRSKRATPDDDFDADTAIATGELGTMIPELLEALSGEMALA